MKKQSYYTETLKDKFTLSPLQQYLKYGRWPYKLIIGCCLVVLTSIQAVYVSEHFQFMNPTLMATWNSVLLSSAQPNSDSDIYINIPAFQQAFSRTLINLESLNDLTIVQVNNNFTKVTMGIQYVYPNSALFDRAEKFRYVIPIGRKITKPFDQDDTRSIKQFWQGINNFDLHVSNLAVLHNKRWVCWDLKIKYKYVHGYIVAKLVSWGGVCLWDNKPFITDGWSGLHVLILMLATLDLIMNVKYIYEVMEMYTRNIYFSTWRIPDHKLKNHSDLTTLKIILRQQRPWHQLSFQQKMLFFDLFLPLRLLGNGLQIVASMIILIQSFTRIDSLSYYEQTFVGMGCFLAWFSITKYLEYFQCVHIIVSVLESSIVPITMAIISFAPVFIAYLFLGMSLFGNSSRFDSVNSSVITLVSLLYMDSIRSIVEDSSMQQNLKVAIVYVVTYLIFFILAVTNIMIALIQEQLEQRKQINEKENDLMEGFDIRPPTLNRLQRIEEVGSASKSDSRMQSMLINDQALDPADNQKRKQHISFKTVAKLAVMLQRNPGKKCTQETLAQDWSRLAGLEIKQHYLNKAIHQVTQEIKTLIENMERDLMSDIVVFNLNLVDKKEVIHLYCAKLLSLNDKLAPLQRRLDPKNRRHPLEFQRE